MAYSTSVARRTPVWATDFLSTQTNQSPFAGSLLVSGTINTAAAAGVATKEHPGVVLVRSSATINSGYYAGTTATAGVSSLLIGGGEQFDIVFWTAAAFTGTTFRAGFIDKADHNAVEDGAWLEFAGSGVIVGKTSSNSTVSTTATLATLGASTWYHGRVAVNAAGTSVQFTIYSDAGASLGSAALTANIPTASGRETACGVAVFTTGSSAADLIGLDFMQVKFTRALARGALS
jgi:hypothetical protein